MIGILLAGVSVAIIWYLLTKNSNYWNDKGVKQTGFFPMLGDLWITILRRISYMDLVQKIYNTFPNERYVGMFQFNMPTLFIRDPELIKQITVKDFDHFTDHRGIVDTEVDPLTGGILFLLTGQRWREMRATLSGAFTSRKMKNMFHLMEGTAENFVKFFSNKNEDIIEIEMKDTYTRYTNDVIATSAFGIQCDSLSQPKNDFYLMGKQVTNFSSSRRLLVFMGYLFLPKLFKLLRISMIGKTVGNYFSSIISETIKLREEKGILRPDMINLLLEARKGVKQEEHEAIETGFATVTESTYNGKVKQIRNLTDEVITSQVLMFFIAGFDTVSTAMCFGTYELAVNKDVQDKLREEIRESYKKNNGKVTYDMLMSMKYLDMVISEILRIWPPVSAVDRICTKPYTIEPVNQGEVPIYLNTGDLILFPYHPIHRDPAYYPNPDKFEPERFSDENKDSINPYTYMPFGSGPRNCIGSRFALLEIKVLFFHLLLNFEIVPSKKTKIPIQISKKGQQPAAEGGFWFALRRIKH